MWNGVNSKDGEHSFHNNEEARMLRGLPDTSQRSVDHPIQKAAGVAKTDPGDEILGSQDGDSITHVGGGNATTPLQDGDDNHAFGGHAEAHMVIQQIPGGDDQGRHNEPLGSIGLPGQETRGQSARSSITSYPDDGNNTPHDRHGRVGGRGGGRSVEFVCPTFYHGIDQMSSAWNVVHHHEVKYDPLSFTNRCTYYDRMYFKMCTLQLYIGPEHSSNEEQVVSAAMQMFYKYDQVISQIARSFYGLENGNSGLLRIHFVAGVKVTKTKKIKDYMQRAFGTFEDVNVTIGNFMKVKKFESIIKYIANRSVIIGANSADILQLLASIGMY